MSILLKQWATGIAGGQSWSSYWATRGVTPGADATLITEAINEALQTFPHVKITEAGTYDIDGTLYIPSNTTLEFVAGCTLRKATGSAFYHMIANENTQTLTPDVNVTLIGNGLNCDINGIDNVGVVSDGLRGQIQFAKVAGLLVTGIETDTIDVVQYFCHLADVSNVIMRHIDVEGDKDGIHISVGHDILLEDIRTATLDDGIALDSRGYFTTCTTIGDVYNVTIRRWTDDHYASQGGSGLLLLNGSWEMWGSGVDYIGSDIVVNAGNVYMATTDGTSSVAPTHTSGRVTGADGIGWKWMAAGTFENTDIYNVALEDCSWTSSRSFIRTVGAGVAAPMRTYFPGTGYKAIIDDVVISNLTIAPHTTGHSIFLADANLGIVRFENLNFTQPGYTFRIVPREETFIIDEVEFNNCEIDLEGGAYLIANPAMTYPYKINKITLTDSDIRTDDVTRAELFPILSDDHIGEITLTNTKFHHIARIITALAQSGATDGLRLTITATGCTFDEICERLIWIPSATNAIVTFNADGCTYEETSLAMFECNVATSLITVATTGSTGQTIPNLYKGYVDVSASDLFGANMISNGEFADGTGWTAATGWSIDAGVASYNDVNNAASLKQEAAAMLAPIWPSRDYKITFDIAIASGNASIYILNSGGTVAYKPQANYANGSHEVLFTAPADVGVGGVAFFAYTASNAAFTIDNITMSEV